MAEAQKPLIKSDNKLQLLEVRKIALIIAAFFRPLNPYTPKIWL